VERIDALKWWQETDVVSLLTMSVSIAGRLRARISGILSDVGIADVMALRL